MSASIKEDMEPFTSRVLWTIFISVYSSVVAVSRFVSVSFPYVPAWAAGIKMSNMEFSRSSG